MIKKYFLRSLVAFVLFFEVGFSQTSSSVGQAQGTWVSLMKGNNFDPNDDQQSVADTDFVGNATNAMVETQKLNVNFSDGITDDVYYFRVRMGQSNPSTSFYLGLDVSGDLIADVFIEANMKSQTPYVSFHQRDYSKTGISPSQTAWLNTPRNNELYLGGRNAYINSYSAQTNIDGGNSGVDYWIEFGFTEESLKAYVLSVFGLNITGDSAIALYGFTSTSQTSNGDIAGIDDTVPGVMDRTWEELGVIINGSFNNITSGEIITPQVNSQTTSNTSPTITGTWGGNMLGDDSLSVTVNGVTYTQQIYINNTNWSLTILYPELLPATYEVIATTTRTSNGAVKTDITTAELIISPNNNTETVTSGNEGGLESNGDLASLIAKRNFTRIKTNSFVSDKKRQKKYLPSNAKTVSSGYDFNNLIPSTGISGTETTFVSSPTDLTGITNAKQVYSVDYYQGEARVAAVLATASVGSVYSHSKAICDRLNNSSLEDITTIYLNGYEIILVKIKRANGLIEYALNFSVQQLATENVFHSYWNIEQYPSGDYLNFQVWGSSTGQVCNIASTIINKFKQLETLSTTVVENRIPTVFVKNGKYKNGLLQLTIINKSRAFNLAFQGNKKTTELAVSDYVSQSISLAGSYEQNVDLNLGGLFDVGLSIMGDKSKQIDALYLADGPWGLDYSKTESTISKFEISNPINSVPEGHYAIERNTKVEGTVYGTMNLFRNILPGELALDASNFSQVGFSIQNTLATEIVLVTENLTDWNNRLRIQIPANATNAEISIALADFKNATGKSYTNEKIKGFVFSTIGNYTSFQPFVIEISNLNLSNAKALDKGNNELVLINKMYNYPNPCNAATTLVLPKTTKSANVKIIDLNGRIIKNNNYTSIDNNNEIPLGLENTSKGVYMIEVTTKENETFKTKLIVK